jgi:hypothetical protein
VFESLGRAEAVAFDIPDLPLVVVPHPVATHDEATLRELAKGLTAQILAALTGKEEQADADDGGAHR